MTTPRDDWSACEGYKECECGGAKRPARHSPAGCELIRPVGRPPRADEPALDRVEIRLTAAERKAWERAATAAGLSLSEWIRRRCETAAVERER